MLNELPCVNKVLLYLITVVGIICLSCCCILLLLVVVESSGSTSRYHVIFPLLLESTHSAAKSGSNDYF